LGSFDMLFLVLQANYCEKNQLDGNFFLSWHQYDLMLLDYIVC